MMPISLVVAYVIFSTFAFYQTLHLKHFRGASATFEFILGLSAFAAMICGFIFLVYYGWTVRWYLPLLLVLLSLILQTVWFGIEAFLRVRELPAIISLLGFFVWPIAAICTFRALP
jgi:hypothetical protein